MKRRIGKGRGRKGEIADHHEPTWDPLYEILGCELSARFMWMADVHLRDGTAIHLYRHAETRRYLQLDDELRAWIYGDDGLYRRIDLRHAVSVVFASWRDFGASPGQLLLVEEAWTRALTRDEDAERRPATAVRGPAHGAPAEDAVAEGLSVVGDGADGRAAA